MDMYHVPSDRLKELGKVLPIIPGFEQYFGKLVQFRLVVDTNIVLGDIHWLAENRKGETTRTCLLETIDAGVLDIYAPPNLFDEVEKHIPTIAQQYRVNIELLYKEWELYKPRLKIIKPNQENIDKYSKGIDPDDAPFIALAEQIQAKGVISKDKHISMMGGQTITFDFLVSMRNYSRAAAININVNFMGYSCGLVTIAALRGIFEGINNLLVGITKAPDWVKISLVIGLIFTAINPTARNKIIDILNKVMSGIQLVTPEIINHIAEASALAQEHNKIANKHLELALSEIKANE